MILKYKYYKLIIKNMKNKLVYPIFLDCCKYTKDVFWQYIFEDLAYSKPPYGTFITKNYLCSTYKNKEFTYKIDTSKVPEIIFTEIFDLLSNKLGLLSDKDKLKRREFFNLQHSNIKKDNWSQIKHKIIKNIYIRDYIISSKKKYKFSQKDARKLFSFIMIGFLFKTITTNDIDFSHEKINKINGINFAPFTIIYTKNIYNCSSTSSLELMNDKKMSDNWEKYLTKLIKNSK